MAHAYEDTPNLSGVVPTGPMMKGLALLVGPGGALHFYSLPSALLLELQYKSRHDDCRTKSAVEY